MGLFASMMGQSVANGYNDMLRLGTGMEQGTATGIAQDIGRASGIVLTVVAVAPEAAPAKTAAPEVEAVAEGGAYKDLTTDGQVRHHIPAKAASPLSKEEGPAVRMDPTEHMKTASFGSSKAAQAYRAKQAELINQGKFTDAQQMDVNDLQSKFGSKYNNGIKQAHEYTKTIPSEKLKPSSQPAQNR
jgi:hypothetical protein